jgi:uncharacterized protein YidB (DUF937 family)
MGLLDAFGATGGSRGFGMSPLTLALAGLVAYRTLNGKGRLADMLGTSAAAATGSATAATGSAAAASPAAGAPTSGLAGLLAGGGLSAGLKDLLDRFRQTGQEKTAQSWVSTGPNQPIAPHDLEQALGEERLQWLMEQTGMPKDQLLNGLSSALPETISKLTPNGHIPSDEEFARSG